MLKVHGKLPRLIIPTNIVLINLQASLLKRFSKKGITHKVPLLLTHGIELTSCFLPWVSPLLNNPTPSHDLPAHSEGFCLSSSCSGRFLAVGPSLYLSLELWIWVPV